MAAAKKISYALLRKHTEGFLGKFLKARREQQLEWLAEVIGSNQSLRRQLTDGRNKAAAQVEARTALKRELIQARIEINCLQNELLHAGSRLEHWGRFASVEDQLCDGLFADVLRCRRLAEGDHNDQEFSGKAVFELPEDS